jgi:hypothetical protein
MILSYVLLTMRLLAHNIQFAQRLAPVKASSLQAAKNDNDVLTAQAVTTIHNFRDIREGRKWAVRLPHAAHAIVHMRYERCQNESTSKGRQLVDVVAELSMRGG